MLSIRSLSFRYPTASSDALNDVSFNAARGEVLGLLGPNGAGKTTLIAHISGLLPIQNGEITFDQQSLAAARAKNPTRIAVAPQEYAFYPSLTVVENLDCFAGVGGLTGKEKKSRITECLATAQLENYTAVRADHLSGGLKRRLNLAIALLHRPELLLFDEPTVGVDPQSRVFILEAVKKLALEGCAVIYTSHYMEEVQSIADRVVILDQGRVLKQGLLADLLNASGEQHLQIAVAGGQEEILQTLLAAFGRVIKKDTGFQLTLDGQHGFAAVFSAIENAGLVLGYARIGNDNLEQLFMSLTHRSLRD
ncbi:MAG: ABC transporter ATP-binding protein [Gallionellaceae bacterium]|jgi:ABC-2 type transport system ATP-binding protein